jgi:hypothetical protein
MSARKWRCGGWFRLTVLAAVLAVGTSGLRRQTVRVYPLIDVLPFHPDQQSA